MSPLHIKDILVHSGLFIVIWSLIERPLFLLIFCNIHIFLCVHFFLPILKMYSFPLLLPFPHIWLLFVRLQLWSVIFLCLLLFMSLCLPVSVCLIVAVLQTVNFFYYLVFCPFKFFFFNSISLLSVRQCCTFLYIICTVIHYLKMFNVLTYLLHSFLSNMQVHIGILTIASPTNLISEKWYAYQLKNSTILEYRILLK